MVTVFKIGNGPADTFARLLESATDPDYDVRTAVLTILDWHWPERTETRRALGQAAIDPQSQVRENALRQLLRHEPHSNWHQAMMRSSTDPAAHLRALARVELNRNQCGHQPTWQELLRSTDHENWTVRYDALMSMAMRWPDRTEVRRAVERAAEDNDPRLRAAAAVALDYLSLPGRAQSDLLLAMTRDNHWRVRREALNQLALWSGSIEDVFPRVLDLAGDKHVQVRDLALQLLTQCWPDHPQVVATAVQAATNDSWFVRSPALTALAVRQDLDVGGQEALRHGLCDPHTENRRTAERALAASSQGVPTEPGRLTEALHNDSLTPSRSAALIRSAMNWPDRTDISHVARTIAGQHPARPGHLLALTAGSATISERFPLTVHELPECAGLRLLALFEAVAVNHSAAEVARAATRSLQDADPLIRNYAIEILARRRIDESALVAGLREGINDPEPENSQRCLLHLALLASQRPSADIRSVIDAVPVPSPSDDFDDWRFWLSTNKAE